MTNERINPPIDPPPPIMSTSEETNSTQVFPQEILDIIIQHTFEPWPTFPSKLPDTALKSRLKSPFLLVSKLCQQAIHTELSQTLWLEIKMPNILARRLRSVSDIFDVVRDFKLDLSLTVLKETSEPTIARATVGVPFNYALFSHMMCFYALYSYEGKVTISLEKGHLTNRMTQVAHQKIEPLLRLFFNNRPVTGPREFSADCVRLPPLNDIKGGPNFFDTLESAVFAYQEYCKLKSQRLHAEADIFILHADSSLNNIDESRGFILDLSWADEAFSNSNHHTNATHVCIIQCHKIMLEIAILASSVYLRLYLSETDWFESTPSLHSSLWFSHRKYFGLSDIDRARLYLARGFFILRHMASMYSEYWEFPSFRETQKANTYLAIAIEMFPDNGLWKEEICSNRKVNHELNGRIPEVPVDVPLPVRQECLDSEGNSRYHFGTLEDDMWTEWPTVFKCMPQLQRFSLSCVASLEKRLGIENGEWWTGCKDADMDGLSDGMEGSSIVG